jgi:hypothetical protein
MQVKYKANRSFSATVGVTSFRINEGEVVHLTQVDSTYAKVLVDYGAGMIDWMSAGVFHKVFDEVK